MEGRDKDAGGEGAVPKKPRESLKDLKSRMRRNIRGKKPAAVVKDVYEKADRSQNITRKGTGIVYDDSMALHKCEWDANYPERPERYLSIINRFKDLDLLARCQRLEIQTTELADIERVHAEEMHTNLERICAMTDMLDVEKEASNYDAIFINKDTSNAAHTAVSAVITLIQEICLGTVQNGFAVVRPPGHHASYKSYNGYCFFNNVAIGARFALAKNLARKILIVDFDVHHGQGVQRSFYNDNNVLYFSIHRFEFGKFWPNLRESNFDYVGVDKGAGYNVNVPLNEIGLGDDDYMSIVLNILLPIGYEFQPDLIIVSAGYDACIGCPEGLMKVTPGFYGHLIKLLSGLASGKIAVCLEGGYFLPSLAEGAAMTLKSLLNDMPAFLPPLKEPALSTVRTINDVKCTLRRYWKCFRHVGSDDPQNSEEVHNVVIKFFGSPDSRPPYETRDCYPLATIESVEKHTKMIAELKTVYEKLDTTNVVLYSVDPAMTEHKPAPGETTPVECPDRLNAIMKTFEEFGLDARCRHADPKLLDISWIEEIHAPDYVYKLLKSEIDLEGNRDLYFGKGSWKAITKAVACVVAVVDGVLRGTASSGIAIVRPPGHHAEEAHPLGFCFVNNVAVGAKYALNTFALKRILILDFDIHHGNGTQKSFYGSNEVLYVSIHRYNNGKFYPNTREGNFRFCGKGDGLGYNVNIPLNADKVRDLEYLEIFHRIVLPIAYEYAPELVLVSAGYDAGVNDPLGGYSLTPQVFGHFVHMLKSLANGRVVLVTEGGYNVTTLAYSVAMSVKALLGDPLLPIPYKYHVKKSVKETIANVINMHKEFWSALRVNRKLPVEVEELLPFMSKLSVGGRGFEDEDEETESDEE